MNAQPVLINGQWKPSSGKKFFGAVNPRTTELLPEQYPVSPWSEVESVLQAAAKAAETVHNWSGLRFANFLDAYANLIEQNAPELVEIANLETGLPVQPRLKDVELPR